MDAALCEASVCVTPYCSRALQDGRGAGAPAGGRGGGGGGGGGGRGGALPGGPGGPGGSGGGGGPQGPFGGQRGAAAGDAVGHRLVHPQHLGVAGGVRAEGALVSGEAPAAGGRGGRAPEALGAHAQVQRGRDGVQRGRLGRALVPGGAGGEVRVGGRVEEKGALQLGGRPVGRARARAGAGGPWGRAGSVVVVVVVVVVDVVVDGVLDAYVREIDLGLCGRKVTQAADVRLLIWGGKRERGQNKEVSGCSTCG